MISKAMRTLRARLDKVEAEGFARAVYYGNTVVNPLPSIVQCQHDMQPLSSKSDLWSTLYPDSYIVQCGKCGLCVGMQKERS